MTMAKTMCIVVLLVNTLSLHYSCSDEDGEDTVYRRVTCKHTVFTLQLQ